MYESQCVLSDTFTRVFADLLRQRMAEICRCSDSMPHWASFVVPLSERAAYFCFVFEQGGALFYVAAVCGNLLPLCEIIILLRAMLRGRGGHSAPRSAIALGHMGGGCCYGAFGRTTLACEHGAARRCLVGRFSALLPIICSVVKADSACAYCRGSLGTMHESCHALSDTSVEWIL
jgi:hypothetical protein